MRSPQRLLSGLVATGAVEAAWGALLWGRLGGDEGFAWFAISGPFLGALSFTASLAFLAARSGSRGGGKAPDSLRRAGPGPGGTTAVPGGLRGKRTSRGD